jgi:alpha-glucosidase
MNNLKFSLSFILISLFATQIVNSQSYTATSPDKSIQVRVEEGEQLQYAVTFAGQTIIEKSDLGFSFKNEPDLQKDLHIFESVPSSHHEIWTPVVKSKHARITDSYNELKLVAKEKSGKHRRMDIIFRVYDDGIAFRYKLYRSEHIGNRLLTKELTTFNIPSNPDAWVVEYKGGKYASSQEDEFRQRKLYSVSDKTIAGLPFLIKQTDNCWIAITEAEIDNYAGFYIGTNGQKNQLTTKLSPLPGEDEQGVKVRFADDIQTPWRVIMIGNNPGTLIESEIIQNLNPPCAINNPTWIKPGMSAWDHWWTGNVKMEMPVIKEYIDFASEMGWPYMLVDWQWYGPFNKPEADICKEAPQLNMAEILSYAKSKNVRIWLWLYSSDVNRNDAYKKAFLLYKKWGVAGIKIDFMDRDDQEMVNWYHDIVRCAAENQLMVDFHGAYKPDGIIRTWPNLITREGVMGNEQYKLSNRMSPEHNVKLAFTRMLAGGMDYTPGGFNNVTAEAFKKQSPSVIANTRAAELAKFVVYESAYTVVADHPQYILGQPGADFLKIVPTVWDNIKFLSGSPDEYVAIAKRSGSNWFIGVLNNSVEKEVTIDTKFLAAGKYTIEIWADAKDANKNPKNITKAIQTLEAGNPLKVKLAKAGGYVAVIRQPLVSTSVEFQTSDTLLGNLYVAAERVLKDNIVNFHGRSLLTEGGNYGVGTGIFGGMWLESQPVASEMYAKRDMLTATNTVQAFIDCQRTDGKIPGMVILKSDFDPAYNWLQGYYFPYHTLNLFYWNKKQDIEYLRTLYQSIEAYDNYLWKYRDSDGDGCLESWSVWDTAEDFSNRFTGTKLMVGGWSKETPPTDLFFPMESLDLMGYSYDARITLAKISTLLGYGLEKEWTDKAKTIRDKVREYLWDDRRGAAFDRDCNNKVMPAMHHNNFQALHFGTFSQEMADRFIKEHLLNPEEFWTPMPLPSIAVNDTTFRNTDINSWSGQPQALTYQRIIRGLENYGYYSEISVIGEKLIHCYGSQGNLFTQQVDPFTGLISSLTDKRTGYTPAAVSSLEYVARLYGIHVQFDEIYWGALGRGEHAISYTQHWDGNSYKVSSKNGETTGSINGKELFHVTNGVRVVTDWKGKVIKIINIKGKPLKVNFQIGNKKKAIMLQSNEIFTIK